MEYRAGMKLRSAVCATEVVIVKPPQHGAEIRCGGKAMLPASAGRLEGAEIDEDHRGGTLIGKRYVDAETGVEVLCVKAGEGSLASGDTPLDVQGARSLPPSD